MEIDIELELQINEHMLHDNGWVFKIDRGLDFYQKPDSLFGIGSNNLLLRKCVETRVDISKK
ncbi:hypothetical protein H4W00_001558 [Psychrobacter sp. PL19]|uniref:MIT C-terminal domain-containing protein n=1 Tax=Psychrobacter sp. PL19 TaxID=2760711 RepID=UPI00302C1753